LLRNLESHGERNRGLYVLKSRGMDHSNQVREFTLTNRGIRLRELYAGTGAFLTGRARATEEARSRAEQTANKDLINRKRRELLRKRAALDAQLSALRAAYETEAEEVEMAIQNLRSNDRSDQPLPVTEKGSANGKLHARGDGQKTARKAH
jgi:circadian clock protein KaiC